jgi:hypothetical protein
VADFRYPPVGQCIYCLVDGASEPLQDEHIIPLGLNGHYVLPKASCRHCADVTSSFERFCLREMLLEARVHLKMKTRRPKERPTSLKVYRDGQEFKLPVKDHPLNIRLPIFETAPVLNGRTAGGWAAQVSPFFWTASGFPGDEEHAAERIAALKDFTIRFNYAPTEFALMLAKIAHAATIAYRGNGTFEPLLNRIIVEKSTEVHDFVGGRSDSPWLERDTSFHIHIREGQEYITAELCLFASLGAPVYEVVVGRRFEYQPPHNPASLLDDS